MNDVPVFLKRGDNWQGDCEHLNALLIQGLNSAPN